METQQIVMGNEREEDPVSAKEPRRLRNMSINITKKTVKAKMMLS